jgi:2-iminobutanoate/2-iminopropanoate deaminase
MARRVIHLPQGAPRPISYYSHGVQLNGMLYTAGQTARDQTGTVVGVGDAAAQAQQAFHNLSLVLGDAGMDFSHIVRLNILVRAAADLAAILEVKDRLMGGCLPTLTCAVVEGLALPDYLLELEAIAVM